MYTHIYLKIKANDPSVVFTNQGTRDLIMKYDVFSGEELKNLIVAAQYLQVDEF